MWIAGASIIIALTFLLSSGISDKAMDIMVDPMEWPTYKRSLFLDSVRIVRINAGISYIAISWNLEI